MADESNPTYDELRDLADRIQQGETDPALTTRLATMHPADRADIVEELSPEDSLAMLRSLTVEEAAEVIEYLEDEETTAIAEQMPIAELAAILDEMAPDDAADLLGDLEPARAQAVLAEMDEGDAVRSLMAFPDDTAGGLMIPIAFHLRESMTVSETLQVLRATSPDPELIYYLFVEDMGGRLVGVASLRRLVVAAPDTLVGDIMDGEVRSVHALTDQEACGRLIQRYGLLALPVVDDAQRLLGVITADDLVEVVAEEAEEDTLLLGGLSGESEAFDSTRAAIRKRLPWLYVNTLTAFLAASVVNLFQGTIEQFAVLATFQGIVAGQGGNAGTQTLTLIVRGLATQNLGLRDAWDLMRREALLGVIQGAAIGLGVALIALLWKGDPTLSLILWLALTGNMLMANVAGVLIPLLLERVGVDPAVASGVFVTTVTDICGFFLFLGLATLLLG